MNAMDFDAKQEFEKVMTAIGEALAVFDYRRSGNLFYRYYEGKKIACAIEVQRSMWNSAESCSFTMNVACITVNDLQIFPRDRLTVKDIRKAFYIPKLCQRAGVICYGYDAWYELSLKNQMGTDAYIQQYILPSLAKIQYYLNALLEKRKILVQ